ncbi:helix-turn-helix domain-containing protein [Acidiferrobacter sp.]|uniref:helix-turn-helix domain-containing protein n=1 Tax=Acidiferrobacter sp. TaxID=1872107 RepID=UPI00260A7BA4|nr:helix-turn-helix domain-containing protein [Acidiferrobacter sp.]
MGIEDPASGEAPVNPGARLRAARERAGWSVEQVAQRLRLSPSQIVAIESGRREDLPPAAYVRGYLRSYAQLLGLDPQEFAKARASDEGAPPPPPLPAAHAPVPAVGMRLGPALYGLFLVAVVAGVVVWHAHEHKSGVVQAPSQAAAPVTGVLPPRLTNLTAMRNRSGELRTFPLGVPAANEPSSPLASSAPHLRQKPAPTGLPPVVLAQAPIHPRAPALPQAAPARRPAATVTVRKGHVAHVQRKAAISPASMPASASRPPIAVPSPGGLVSLPQGRRYVGLQISTGDAPVRVTVRDASGTRLMAGRIAVGHTINLIGRPPFRLTLSRSRGVEVKAGGHVIALPRAHQGRNLRVTVNP